MTMLVRMDGFWLADEDDVVRRPCHLPGIHPGQPDAVTFAVSGHTPTGVAIAQGQRRADHDKRGHWFTCLPRRSK